MCFDYYVLFLLVYRIALKFISRHGIVHSYRHLLRSNDG